MNHPSVSVVMSVFNDGGSGMLDLAITSILQQDMSDWELLVCDDGSTDGTYEQLTEWANKDPRIRVFRNAVNRKAAAARNRCLREAAGTYVAIMDADDACSTNRLRIQADFLDQHPEISFVGVLGERFSKTPGDADNPYWFCASPQPKDFLMTLPFVHASILFRREDLLKVGGYREISRVERSEDYDLLLRMYAEGYRGANTRDAVYYIRQDRDAFHRRKYRYRFKESAVKFAGFYRLKLMPQGIPFAVKPLIVGLIPNRILEGLKKRYYSQRMR